MRGARRNIYAVIAGVAALAGAAPAFASDNWMRDHVRQWEESMVLRAGGDRALADFKAQPRIIGGTQSKSGAWPFQVALLNASVPSNFDAQFCGGSLISKRHVLTAAHCLDFLKNAGQLRVLTGTQSLATGGTRQVVAKFKFHPKWDPKTSDYDIGVITLAADVNGIAPVKIIQKSQESSFASTGTTSLVIGWGDTDPGNGTSFPKKLREVQVPLVSRGVCNKPISYDGDVTSRMICAGFAGGGKDSCQGDSGGPLLVKDNKGKFLLQAGIVSWGNGCALPNFFGVYSRLATLGNFATNIVNADPAAGER